MAKVETVAIQHPEKKGEKLIINKSDFKDGKHKLYKDGKAQGVQAGE